MTETVIILVIGFGTYLERLSFVGIVGDRQIPDWALLPLRFVAPAVFAAIVVPTVLLVDGSVEVSPRVNPAVLATLLALLVAWRTKSVAATIVVGMGAIWLLDAVF
jgi:branched-subunit amino acid transport protein